MQIKKKKATELFEWLKVAFVFHEVMTTVAYIQNRTWLPIYRENKKIVFLTENCFRLLFISLIILDTRAFKGKNVCLYIYINISLTLPIVVCVLCNYLQNRPAGCQLPPFTMLTSIHFCSPHSRACSRLH